MSQSGAFFPSVSRGNGSEKTDTLNPAPLHAQVPANGKPYMRRFGWFVVLGAILVSTLWVVFNYERYAFARKIRAGMSRDEVMQSVGRPATIKQPGETLDEWGNNAQLNVQAETWVYFVFPKSQHRFVLTFSQDKVIGIAHEQN